MKQILFTLLLFCLAGLYSCRKDVSTQVDIKTYDQQQIQSYISANGLTGFSRDLSGGDTTGIYYKILSQGKGATVGFPDVVSIVFTVTTFDGGFVAIDTIPNHLYNYIGHLTNNYQPIGIELALINILKNKGTRARVLIPSHLAYGVSGSTLNGTATANPIKGNQCLDYYINMINNDPIVDPVTGKNVIDPTSGLKVTGQDVYDDLSVKNYMTANNLTGFTKTASGLYYKVTSMAAGAMAISTSMVTFQYTGTLFDGVMPASQSLSNSTSGTGEVIDLANDNRKGLVEALKLAPVGSKMTIILPSRLAFGIAGNSSDVGPFNCIQYDINIISIQ